MHRFHSVSPFHSFSRFTYTKAYKNLLNELGDQAGQHEVIAENLSTQVVHELNTLVKQLKDDRRKVSNKFIENTRFFFIFNLVVASSSSVRTQFLNSMFAARCLPFHFPQHHGLAAECRKSPSSRSARREAELKKR